VHCLRPPFHPRAYSINTCTMALIRFSACLLGLAPALCEGTSLLQRSAARQRSFSGLRYSPQDPAARTLLTLDTNHDGRIDPNEIARFAKKQGLDPAAATQEFSSIDSNGDRELDSLELQRVLGGSSLQQAQVQEVAVDKLQAAPVKLRTSPAEPETEPSLALDSAPSVVVEAPLATELEETPVLEEAPVATRMEAAKERLLEPPALAAVEPTLTEVAPAAENAIAIEAPAAESVELISDVARNSMRMAAKKVADELLVEENEENEARALDRSAAETRANSSALAKKTLQDALDASSKAAKAKADELVAQLSSLEEQAERAEVRAAALRAKAKMEAEEGNELMAAAEQAMRLP